MLLPSADKDALAPLSSASTFPSASLATSNLLFIAFVNSSKVKFPLVNSAVYSFPSTVTFNSLFASSILNKFSIFILPSFLTTALTISFKPDPSSFILLFISAAISDALLYLLLLNVISLLSITILLLEASIFMP